MNQQIDFANVPLSDGTKEYEKNQRYLVEDWMRVQGYEEEEIAETVGDYLESGLLKKQAGIAQKKLVKWQEGQNQALLQQRQEAQEASQAEQMEIAEDFRDAVLETREISGFKISDKKAEKLYDYITKRDKDGLSQFDKDDNAENRLLYAYFAMEGFDKGKLSKEVATQHARKLKRKLSNFSDGKTSPKRSSKQVRRTNQETPKIHWIT